MTPVAVDWRHRFVTVACAMALLVPLVGCSSNKADEYVEGSVDTLYNQAMDNLLVGNNRTAAKLFDEVERQHPYSVWATKAELMAAYAHYQEGEYDEAVIALDRFIQLHPGNRDITYAYYLRALSYYAQIGDVKRDSSAAEQSVKAFDELIRRFPNSRYTRDAREHLDLARDHLAGTEMDRGRYYLKRKQYLAAINRFKTVVDQYQTTTQVPEALHRLVEAYTALGVTDEAQKAAAVLGYNFPDSPWYADTYELVEGTTVRPPDQDKKSFWSSIF